QSRRALLGDAATGSEVGTAVREFPHGVITTRLPDSDVRLGPEWALQAPDDYWSVLAHVVPEALRAARASAADVTGIGIDFTSCTMLPTMADGTPLCRDGRFRSNPHAWVTLWKP